MNKKIILEGLKILSKFDNFEINVLNVNFEIIEKREGTLFILIDYIKEKLIIRFFQRKKCFSHDIFHQEMDENILKKIIENIIKNICFIHCDFLVIQPLLLNKKHEKKLIYTDNDNENEYFILKVGIDKSKIIFFQVSIL